MGYKRKCRGGHPKTDKDGFSGYCIVNYWNLSCLFDRARAISTQSRLLGSVGQRGLVCVQWSYQIAVNFGRTFLISFLSFCSSRLRIWEQNRGITPCFGSGCVATVLQNLQGLTHFLVRGWFQWFQWFHLDCSFSQQQTIRFFRSGVLAGLLALPLLHGSTFGSSFSSTGRAEDRFIDDITIPARWWVNSRSPVVDIGLLSVLLAISDSPRHVYDIFTSSLAMPQILW